MLRETVAYNIKKMRLLNNYTQEDVAYSLQISFTTYNRIEKGKSAIDMDKLEAFANFYKVDPYTILKLSDKESFKKQQPDEARKQKDNYTQLDVELARCEAEKDGLINELEAAKHEVKLLNDRISDKDKIIQYQSDKITSIQSTNESELKTSIEDLENFVYDNINQIAKESERKRFAKQLDKLKKASQSRSI